ncbi:MAG TPA: ankyrin repeat domain-containing protein [Herpetosiphonaceae bacterium]
MSGAWIGRERAAGILLCGGSNYGYNGAAPIIVAIRQKEAVMDDLLRLGQRDAEPSSDVARQLILFAKEGDLAALQAALAQGVAPDTCGEDGYTALMAAAREGHAELVRQLLASGADPNAAGAGSRYAAGASAMQLAQRADIIQLLLDAGADYPAAIPPEWLEEPLDLAALAPAMASWHPTFRARWDTFLGMRLPTDTLWTFRSPADSWANLAGRAGYAIVHDGRPVRTLVTMMN